MIDDILYKLNWSRDGVWSARLSPDECGELLEHIEQIKHATVQVQGQQVDIKVVRQPGDGLPLRGMR